MSFDQHAKDDDSSDRYNGNSDESSTSSSTSDGYEGNPHWMEKFNMTKLNHDKEKVETNNSRNTLSISNDWMKKFERKQNQKSSLTSSPYIRDAKSSLSLPIPDSKQASNVVRRKSADEAKEIKRVSQETMNYIKLSYSRTIDKSKRRERIRQNLEILRWRKNIRENKLKDPIEHNGLQNGLAENIWAKTGQEHEKGNVETQGDGNGAAHKNEDRVRQNIPALTNQDAEGTNARGNISKRERTNEIVQIDLPTSSMEAKNSTIRDAKTQDDRIKPSPQASNVISRFNPRTINAPQENDADRTRNLFPVMNVSKTIEKHDGRDGSPQQNEERYSTIRKEPMLQNVVDRTQKDTSKKDARVKKDGKLIKTEFEKQYDIKTSSHKKSNEMSAMSPTIRQPSFENNAEPPKENTISNSSGRKTATKKINSTCERKVAKLPAQNTYFTENHEAAQRRKIDSDANPRAHKETNIKVFDFAQSTDTSAQRTVIKLPSIGPKLDSFRQAIQRNSTRGNATLYPNSVVRHNHFSKPSSTWKKTSELAAITEKEDGSSTNDTLEKQMVEKLPLSSGGKSESAVSDQEVSFRSKDGTLMEQIVDPKSSLLLGKNSVPAAIHENVNGHLKDVPGIKTVERKDHSNRGEIETSVPKNLFGMWGETVKAKKPAAVASKMSDSMIKNQADKIKQRIERARKEANNTAGHHIEYSTSDEKSIGIVLDPNESASALFFGGQGRNIDFENSTTLENAAAAMYGFGAAEEQGEDSHKSISMNNSAAAMFGFGAAEEQGEDSHDSISMNNSAAAMCGFGSAGRQQEDSHKSTSMNNSVAAMYGFATSEKQGEDSNTPISMNNSAAATFGYANNEEKIKDSQKTMSVNHSVGEVFVHAVAEEIDKNAQNSSTENAAVATLGFAPSEKRQRDVQNESESEEGNESLDKEANGISHGVYSTSNVKKNDCDEADSESESNSDSSMDQEAAALFYGSSFKITKNNGIDHVKHENNPLDKDDSTKNMKKIDVDEAHSCTESKVDSSMDQDTAALFHSASIEITKNNDTDHLEQESKPLNGISKKPWLDAKNNDVDQQLNTNPRGFQPRQNVSHEKSSFNSLDKESLSSDSDSVASKNSNALSQKPSDKILLSDSKSSDNSLDHIRIQKHKKNRKISGKRATKTKSEKKEKVVKKKKSRRKKIKKKNKRKDKKDQRKDQKGEVNASRKKKKNAKVDRTNREQNIPSEEESSMSSEMSICVISDDDSPIQSLLEVKGKKKW